MAVRLSGGRGFGDVCGSAPLDLGEDVQRLDGDAVRHLADWVAGDRVYHGGASGGEERVDTVDDVAGLLDFEVVGWCDADLAEGVEQLAVLAWP